MQTLAWAHKEFIHFVGLDDLNTSGHCQFAISGGPAIGLKSEVAFLRNSKTRRTIIPK